MYWFIGIATVVISLIILISYLVRKSRREYLLKWEVDDFVLIDRGNCSMWFRELLEKVQKANQLYNGYSANVVKIKKWETHESLVELANGDSYFIETSWIGANYSCDRRLKLNSMDNFMKDLSTNKQDKREETLNELLENKK